MIRPDDTTGVEYARERAREIRTRGTRVALVEPCADLAASRIVAAFWICVAGAAVIAGLMW